MNVAAAYLERNWERLGLPSPDASDRLVWVAVTPRFRASAHVVFMALADGSPDPVLVAKVSRLPGGADTLLREAENLRAVQAARAGGFDSVPRLVAEDDVADSRLLVETGLAGRVLSAAMVRRRPQACAEALLAWLTELHSATLRVPADDDDVFDRLVVQPLRDLARWLPPGSGADVLVALTAELVRPLRELAVPLVMEHGDLSAPNILVSRSGELGVVDWELAQPRGLPAQDLYFGLTYLAFARAGAARPAEYLAAFHGAFFGPDAWAAPYVERYAASLRLPREALVPLFVACWGRYVARRAARLHDPVDGRLGGETAAWLAQDRFHACWQYTVRNADALHLLH